MKWRLLEGGGQAYYELGVADSGQLIGLSRRDLEQSLETLEMMAGEIGASVIVVKEVEIPAALVGRFMSSALGIPERTPNQQEFEFGLSTATETSATDDDDGIDTPPSDGDTDLVVARQTQFTSIQNPCISTSDFEIEIASVYKPRPHRTRPIAVGQPRHNKRGPPKIGKQKQKIKTKKQAYEPQDTDIAPGIAAKLAVERRQKRDARRDARKKALDIETVVDVGVDVNATDSVSPPTAISNIVTAAPVPIPAADFFIPALEALSVDADKATNNEGRGVVAVTTEVVAEEIEATPVTAIPEPRLIVEALVVRKLALEEAFLDFGGFALEI